LSETMLTFLPQIALSNVDLPTFGRPTKETKPDRIGYRLRVDEVSTQLLTLP
jgi:hypothetical protein